jgi:hypothetical protein
MHGQGPVGFDANDTVDDPAILQVDDRDVINLRHDAARIKEVVEQVARIAPIGASEVGPNLAALPEEHMAGGANLVEDLPSLRSVGGCDSIRRQQLLIARDLLAPFRRTWAKLRQSSVSCRSISGSKLRIWRI